MEKKRGFEPIREDLLPRDEKGVLIRPSVVHSSKKAAGYDVLSISQGVIMPNQSVACRTGIKAYMQDNEVLMIYGRSSLGAKHGVVLANTVGVIDADYYGNESNDGEILVVLRNTGNEPFRVNIGDKIAQAVFTPFLTADENTYCEKNNVRTGGFGSTGK